MAVISWPLMMLALHNLLSGAATTEDKAKADEAVEGEDEGGEGEGVVETPTMSPRQKRRLARAKKQQTTPTPPMVRARYSEICIVMKFSEVLC